MTIEEPWWKYHGDHSKPAPKPQTDVSYLKKPACQVISQTMSSNVYHFVQSATVTRAWEDKLGICQRFQGGPRSTVKISQYEDVEKSVLGQTGQSEQINSVAKLIVVLLFFFCPLQKTQLGRDAERRGKWELEAAYGAWK